MHGYLFVFHFQVNQILNQAIESLPETDLDSKLLINTQDQDSSDSNRKDDASVDGVNPYDRLMCEIVDNMPLNSTSDVFT